MFSIPLVYVICMLIGSSIGCLLLKRHPKPVPIKVEKKPSWPPDGPGPWD